MEHNEGNEFQNQDQRVGSPKYVEDKDISLKQIIEKIGELKREVLSKWLVLVIFATLFSLVGYIIAVKKDTTFVAVTTFMLESDGSSGVIPSYLTVASQLGIISGVNVDEGKIMQILSSNRIIGLALLNEVTINDTTDYLANHYIRIFEKLDEWKDHDELADFEFTDAVINTHAENRAFNNIVAEVRKDFLVVENSKEGILTVRTETTHEQFAKHINDFIVSSVSDYYVSNVTEKERHTVEILQSKVDSIRNALYKAEATWAEWSDRSSNLIKAQGKVKEFRLTRDIKILNVMYGELVKNLELAEFNLLNKTPFFQIIDNPNLPLSKNKTSVLRSMIIAIIMGVGFAGIFIVLRKIYFDIINSN